MPLYKFVWGWSFVITVCSYFEIHATGLKKFMQWSESSPRMTMLLSSFQEECLQRFQNRIEVPYDSSKKEHQVRAFFFCENTRYEHWLVSPPSCFSVKRSTVLLQTSCCTCWICCDEVHFCIFEVATRMIYRPLKFLTTVLCSCSSYGSPLFSVELEGNKAIAFTSLANSNQHFN
jgi:hypothetical protein